MEMHWRASSVPESLSPFFRCQVKIPRFTLSDLAATFRAECSLHVPDESGLPAVSHNELMLSNKQTVNPADKGWSHDAKSALFRCMLISDSAAAPRHGLAERRPANRNTHVFTMSTQNDETALRQLARYSPRFPGRKKT